MPLFRRTPAPDPHDGPGEGRDDPASGPAGGSETDPHADARRAVRDFWSWWTHEDRPADPSPQDLAEHLAPLGLTGEVLPEAAVDPARPGARTLLLDAGGDPARRAWARRLVLAAPDDPAWTLVDHRPAAAAPEEVVLFGDGELVDLDRVRVAARLQGQQLDVTVHHPAFAALGVESRHGLSVQALDAALGELGTELWIGDIAAAASAPVDGFGLGGLRAVVGDLERQHVDPDGSPRWVALQGGSPSGPLVALVRRLLVPASAPHLDTYVSVALPFRSRGRQGLPDDSASAALEAFGQRLAASLGADGEVVAHLSTGGVRTLHVYVDSTTDALDRVRSAAAAWEGGRAKVHTIPDPGWDAVAHLRQ